MEIKKLTKIEEFEALKKGDLVLVEWKDKEKWNKTMNGIKLYKVIENYSKNNEIILQIKDNHYFNFKMLLNGSSIANGVYLIEQKTSEAGGK